MSKQIEAKSFGVSTLQQRFEDFEGATGSALMQADFESVEVDSPENEVCSGMNVRDPAVRALLRDGFSTRRVVFKMK